MEDYTPSSTGRSLPWSPAFTELVNSQHEPDRQAAETFQVDLSDYVRKYGFVAHIVPYRDADLELLQLYGWHLLNRLPRSSDSAVDIGEVDLSHLRWRRPVSMTSASPTTGRP